MCNCLFPKQIPTKPTPGPRSSKRVLRFGCLVAVAKLHALLHLLAAKTAGANEMLPQAAASRGTVSCDWRSAVASGTFPKDMLKVTAGTSVWLSARIVRLLGSVVFETLESLLAALGSERSVGV